MAYLWAPISWAMRDSIDRSDVGLFALVLLGGAAVSVLTMRLLRKI
jgi:hypothetical protein